MIWRRARKYQRCRPCHPPLRLPEDRPEPCEAVAGDREHLVHRGFELKLPVSTIGLQPKKSDVGDVGGVFAVDTDESEGLEQRRHLAKRPDIDKRCVRTQLDFGLPAPGLEVLHIIRVKQALLTA
jgi:hypothetical protein